MLRVMRVSAMLRQAAFRSKHLCHTASRRHAVTLSCVSRVSCGRNLVKALPWFRTVREKLADPAYSGFFLRFRPPNGTNTSSPRCDDNWSPPRCSPFYHDDWQTPFTRGSPGWDSDLRNGVCDPEPCDCGSGVPCGE